jgi:hypothetical protein
VRHLISQAEAENRDDVSADLVHQLDDARQLPLVRHASGEPDLHEADQGNHDELEGHVILVEDHEDNVDQAA